MVFKTEKMVLYRDPNFESGGLNNDSDNDLIKAMELILRVSESCRTFLDSFNIQINLKIKKVLSLTDGDNYVSF